MKGQGIRLLDVIAIGPVMVAGGCEVAKTRPVLGAALGALGLATVVYNLGNYLRARGGEPDECA